MSDDTTTFDFSRPLPPGGSLKDAPLLRDGQFDFDNINPEYGATFVVEHLATGAPMGLGPMSPVLAAKVAAAWRGRKHVIA